MISLAQYLSTTYRPDREFVDGRLIERNLGTPIHGEMQMLAASCLQEHRKAHGLVVFTSVRVELGPARWRVPDVAAAEIPFRSGKFLTDVPAITVEIPSPEDTFDCVLDKCLEYQAFGIRNILVLSPDRRRAFVFDQSTLRQLKGMSIQLTLRSGVIDFPFAEMFAELDEDLNNQSLSPTHRLSRR